MYSNNDWRDYLEHSWGNSPKQKAREKEYNAWYYRTHKDKWKHINDIGDAIKGAGEKAGDWVKDKLGYDEKERMDLARRGVTKAEERLETAKKWEEWDREDYVKSLDGEYFDKDNPDRFWNQYSQSMDRTDAWQDIVRQHQREYKEAYNEYSRTPLGVVSNAIDAGKDAFNNAVDFFKNLRHSDFDEEDELYFEHSWGKEPEQKAREKEYNHQYWEEHKEEIKAKRRAKKNGQGGSSSDSEDSRSDFERNRDILLGRKKENGEFDFEGREITDINSLNDRLNDEIEYLKALMERNGESGDIRQHNQNIIDNLQKLADQVKDEAKNLDGDAAKSLFAAANKQFNSAHSLALDLSKKASNQYLDDIGYKRSSKSGSSSSSGSSSGSDSGSSSNKRVYKGDDADTQWMKKNGVDFDAYNRSRDRGREQVRNLGSNQSSGNAYSELISNYKSGKYKEGPNSAVEDYGEFLAELGELGDNAQNSAQYVAKWENFRRSMGKQTSEELINNQLDELRKRQRR